MPVRFQLSRYGMVFIPVLIAMLLAAINYDNNLVYSILFLLISILVVSMIYTYRNVAYVEVRPGNMWPVFSGGTLRYTLQVFNRGSYPVFTLTFRRQYGESDFRVVCDHIAPGASQSVELIEPALRRGRFSIQRIEVASLFPLGLFRAMIEVPMDWEYVVYPELRGDLPWPEIEPDIRTQDDGHFRGGESFYGLRNYQPGESQRHIDWKAVARGRPLMVKEFASGGTGRLWFDWTQLAAMDTESRLSQLAVWIVQADQLGGPYGLKLPPQTFRPAIGPAHVQKCLTALALSHGGRL